jgi:site-specific DNA-methyltransferase (adenine-specific)
MTPRNVVIIGDAVHRLRSLAPASVDCVVTSPPYYALRNYGARGQIGLESSVTGWVDRLVAVCDEIGRVLKTEGCFWLNLGDSYARSSRHGAPPKSLLLGPERLLLALSERGWIVRNKVVWAKPNPMPSSARDRLTCSWEPLYLLTRSPSYWFDLDAARTPHRSQRRPSPKARIPTEKARWAGPLAGTQSGLGRLKRLGRVGHPLGKNPGDVWTMPTSSFRGGHHATFPEVIVERPLRLSCPERVCAGCGKAWRRAPVRALGHLAVLGDFRPACACHVGWLPGLVLDPFMGSGTTAVVAERLGRDWVGIELNPKFAAIAERRVVTHREANAA